MSKLRTPLANAIGSGSAREGVEHWWAQRITAIALVPLMIWLVYSVVSLVGAPYGEVQAWIAQPLNAVLLSALAIALFYHAELGLQVIVEDYIHHHGVALVLRILFKLLTILAILLALFSIIRIFVS